MPVITESSSCDSDNLQLLKARARIIQKLLSHLHRALNLTPYTIQFLWFIFLKPLELLCKFRNLLMFCGHINETFRWFLSIIDFLFRINYCVISSFLLIAFTLQPVRERERENFLPLFLSWPETITLRIQSFILHSPHFLLQRDTSSSSFKTIIPWKTLYGSVHFWSLLFPEGCDTYLTYKVSTKLVTFLP